MKLASQLPAISGTSGRRRAGRIEGEAIIDKKIGLVVCLLLGGCSFSETIAEHSIGYNKTVAASADAQILLNILRSRDRHPTHFTAVSNFTGNLTQSTRSTFGFSIPFGRNTTDAFGFDPELTISQESKPTFTVSVLDTTKNFASAVLAPIQLSDVKLFLHQGWPLELLLYLAVESGEVSIVPPKANQESPIPPQGSSGTSLGSQQTPPEKVGNAEITFGNFLPECDGIGNRVVNEPQDKTQMTCFRAIVRYLAEGIKKADLIDSETDCRNQVTKFKARQRLRIVDTLSATPVGPPLPNTSFDDVKKLADTRKLGFSFVKVNEAYQMCEIKTKTHFCVDGIDNCNTINDEAKACQKAVNKFTVANSKAHELENTTSRSVPGSGFESFQLILPEPKIEAQKKKQEANGKEVPIEMDAEGKRTKVTFSARLRSLQGMLYYAGELVRNSQYTSPILDEQGYNPATCKPIKDSKPLLKIGKGTPPEGSKTAIAVEHRDELFWIESGEESSASLSVIAFLTQIQALYQSRTDIPVAQPVVTIER